VAAPPPAPAAVPRTPPSAAAEVSPAPYSTPATPSPSHARVEPAAPAHPAPSPQMPSLSEAFAALLSAEQSRAISPSTIVASAVSDDKVDEIVRRVIARIGEDAVRETVVDVAERLVREEIERIKRG
jgi:hypothetical protein